MPYGENRAIQPLVRCLLSIGMSAKARLRRIGRLFVIKTRFEAWIVTYAIALGAIERGRYYLDFYPGAFGWVLAAACTGVVFLAGAKLLDSVQPAPATVQIGPHSARVKRRSRPIRSRSRALPTRSSSLSQPSLRTD